MVDGEMTELGDVIADQNAINPAVAFSEKNSFSHIAELLSILTPREKLIIENRFGLNKTKTVMTLEAISETFGVTRERIRQLQNSALQKMHKKFRRIEKTHDLSQYKQEKAEQEHTNTREK
jgi:RNA polymerase primary sigma factor